MGDDAFPVKLDDFVTPPLAAGAWSRLDAEELALAVAALEEAGGGTRALAELSGPPVRGRVMALPFYGPDWSLIDLEGRAADGAAAASFVVGPRGCAILDGTSPPIHQINHDLRLQGFSTPEHALAYLRFFGGGVWGEEGPFRLVETPDEAAAWLSLPAEALPVIPAAVKAGAGIGTWRFDANLIYSDNLFRSSFEVRPDGMVEMLDDNSVAEAPAARLSFRSPWRVLPARPEGGLFG